MSEPLVTLAEVKQAADPVIVEILEGLLEEAKNGQLVSLACSGCYRGGSTHTSWRGNGRDLFFGVERLRQRILLGGVD